MKRSSGVITGEVTCTIRSVVAYRYPGRGTLLLCHCHLRKSIRYITRLPPRDQGHIFIPYTYDHLPLTHNVDCQRNKSFGVHRNHSILWVDWSVKCGREYHNNPISGLSSRFGRD